MALRRELIATPSHLVMQHASKGSRVRYLGYPSADTIDPKQASSLNSGCPTSCRERQ